MKHSEPGMRLLRTARAGAIDLRQRRIWHEGEGDTTTTTETGQDKTGQGQGNATAFTQADLDRIAGNARKQARESAIAEFLKELGYEKPDDLKTQIATLRQREDAEKSELDKAQQKIAALEKAAQEAKLAAEQAQRERLEERRNAAILTALKDADKPQSVLNLLLTEHASEVQALMAEDGTIDPKKVTGLAELAKKEYAGLFVKSSTPGSQSNAGGRNPAPDPKALLSQIKARI